MLALVFGAGNEMDAFIVASRIPYLLRDLFAEGAISAALVPAFTRRLATEGKASAWQLGNNVLNVVLLATLALVAVAMTFAGPLVTAYAGDYARVPGKLELTIGLTRAMLPFLAMVAAAAIAMGMLNSLHHYFVPALSPAAFNAAVILGAVLLVPLMPAVGLPRIAGIAIAALVGGLAQVGLQWPSLRREGFRYRPVCRPQDDALREVVMLMGPGTIGLAATQVNLFVNTLIATTQGTGAVSWLTYSFRLMYLPIGLFGVSIATAVLPVVSHQAALADEEGIRATTARGLALMLMLNVPASVGLIVLARPIVSLLFEHGRFVAADTAATASAVQLYALGLVGYSTTRIVSPIFYALRQSRVAVSVSVASMAVNVVLAVTLVSGMGFAGLALSAAVAALANGAALAVLLHQRLHGLDGRRLAVVTMKTALAAAVMGVTAWGIESGLARPGASASVLRHAVQLAAAIAGGLVALAATAKLLRLDEFEDALRMLKARVTR